MMAIKIEGQGDFDLETLFDLMDEALTSKDERVQNALRSLLMIVTLTRVREDGQMEINDRARGPLRQMQQDLNDISRRLYQLQDELHNLKMPREGASGSPYNPGAGSPFGPYVNPGSPYGPIWTTGDDPNVPWTTSKTSSSSSYTLTDNEKNSIMDTIKITK
jgi:hypothetical protein